MPIRALILTFLFVLSAHAIVGGRNFVLQTADEDSLKMASHTVVLLNTQNPGSHSRCTGTLIASNVILTAAHCVPNSLENLWVVTSQYEFSVLERHPVVKAKAHESFSFELEENSDLALVKFQGKLPEFYKPTSWVTRFQPELTRFWLPVAGYGETAKGQGDAGELRLGRLTVYDFDPASSILRGDQTQSEGVCKGDSGGPAYLKIGDDFFVLGVVTAVLGQTPMGAATTDSCQGISFLNSTVYYQNWIEQNLKNF